MATSIAWLDRIVEQANFPPSTDREGAALVLGQLLGFTPSIYTVRSWPIPYKVIGKYARYKVPDLIECDEAHRRCPAANRPQHCETRQRQRTSHIKTVAGELNRPTTEDLPRSSTQNQLRD